MSISQYMSSTTALHGFNSLVSDTSYLRSFSAFACFLRMGKGCTTTTAWDVGMSLFISPPEKLEEIQQVEE